MNRYLLALTVLAATFSCSGRAHTPIRAGNVGEVLSGRKLNDGDCVDNPTKLLPEKVSVDIDQDGRHDQIDLLEVDDFRYPILARWGALPSGRPRDAVWAIATHLVVTLSEGESIGSVKQLFRSIVARDDIDVVPLARPNTFLVGIFPHHKDLLAFGKTGVLLKAIPELRKKNLHGAIEPDYLVFADAKKEPVDPKFKLQYDLLSIQAPEAWAEETGDQDVRVAVLDSGVDLRNDDLMQNVILTKGCDLLDGGNQPEDQLAHGSLCASLIGSQGDNALGIAGVNWDVTLLPIKFIDERNCGTSSAAADAVYLAIKLEADVISASWGGLGESANLRKEIERADDDGILFVTSAGNSAVDLDKSKYGYYPASYALPNMIVVGACDDNREPMRESGFGKARVHLCAPGEGVYTADADLLMKGQWVPSYVEMEGASPAVALVSGACALVQAKDRRRQEAKLLNHYDIRCRVLMATDRSNALDGRNCSGGWLNLEKAVKGTGLRQVCGCPPP